MGREMGSCLWQLFQSLKVCCSDIWINKQPKLFESFSKHLKHEFNEKCFWDKDTVFRLQDLVRACCKFYFFSFIQRIGASKSSYKKSEKKKKIKIHTEWLIKIDQDLKKQHRRRVSSLVSIC